MCADKLISKNPFNVLHVHDCDSGNNILTDSSLVCDNSSNDIHKVHNTHASSSLSSNKGDKNKNVLDSCNMCSYDDVSGNKYGLCKKGNNSNYGEWNQGTTNHNSSYTCKVCKVKQCCHGSICKTNNNEFSNNIFSKKGISFAILNIASLPNKMDEFNIFMQNNPVNVIALNETQLDSTIPDIEISIDGYDVYRNDRNRNGGGVAMYISRNSGFTYKARKDLMPPELEIIVIEMKKPKAKPTIVIAWYRPPGSLMKLFDHVESILEQVEHEDKNVLLMGDVNCDLLAKNPHCYTIKMKEVSENFHLQQVITEATRVTKDSESLIDHIYTSCPSNVSESGVIYTGMSDHFSAYLIMDKENKVKKQKHKYSVNRKYKNFDENMFRLDIVNANWCNVTRHSNIDDAVSEFENIFLDIANNHAPLKRKRVRQKNPSPWLTDEILAAMRERDQLKKRASKQNSLSLWDDFRKLRNRVNGMIKESKRTYLTNALKTKDSKEIWTNLRYIVPGKSKHTDISCIKTDQGECSSSKDVADTLNEYFANVGPSIADKIPDAEINDHYVNENVENNMHFIFKDVHHDYVLNQLCSLADKKATGVDEIPSKLLNVSAKEITPIVTFLVNTSLQTGIFPNKWKKARVCPVFKGGDSTDPCNYRPISILPILSKIIERAVFDQMYPFLDSVHMLHDNQSGFRPGFSTSSALLNITEDWLKSIDNGEYIGLVMLDLRKAFDTVNHNLLIEKLPNYGLSAHVVNWFKSYLNDRAHVTAVNGSRSNEQNSVCGIPQGSILGPLLFILYINDLPKYVTNVKVSMYADDTAIYYSSKDVNDIVDRMNYDLENVDNWLAKNKLSLNVDKTHFMLIGTPQKLANVHDNVLNVKIKGSHIQRVNHCKHLGIEIDEKLMWNNQIEQVRKKVLTGLYFLRKAANFIPKHHQSMLYKSIVAPHFDYCNVVWGRCNKTLSTKLQVLQNRAAKIITSTSRYGSSTQALNDLKWKNLEEKLNVNEAVTMYKIVNNLAPNYLCKRFVKKETCYNTRNKNDFLMEKPNTEYLRRSFSYRGAKLWNSLDDNVKNACNLISFKQLII